MKKADIIKEIKELADIHHNITTLGMSFPDTPENMPDEIASDIFFRACGMIVMDIVDEVQEDKRSDTGNRNLCPCPTGGKKCRKHDIWNVYQHGRTGATLYWEKYWKERGHGYYFRHDEEDLQEMHVPELKEIQDDLKWYRNIVEHHKTMLTLCLEDLYNDWVGDKELEERERAMGYYKTLKELLTSDNPQIARLAKGIKKEYTK